MISCQIATVGPAASIINLVKDRGCWLRVERPEAAHVMVHPYKVPLAGDLPGEAGPCRS